VAGQESKVDLMREYPLPQTPGESHKFSFVGYILFGGLAVAILALAVYFAR